MQRSKIFLIGEDGASLVSMETCPYDAERILQRHLADTPDLLPGDQINPENPRRWLLVKQEAGIPAEKEGGNHWSLDHLFVDQDGILTLVECKRSSDPRLRREVVAQLLEYAANATEYWPKGKVRLLAEETAHQKGHCLAEGLRTLLQQDALLEEEHNAFWETVDTNLANGCLRLLFVSDAIPKELRRLIEFLNTKMQDIEVLAVELKQFMNSENHFKAFVPRVIGQTESSQAKKTLLKKRFQTIESQLETYPQRDIFQRIVDLAKSRDHAAEPGITNFSLRGSVHGKAVTYAFGKPTGPSLQFYTEYIARYPALKSSVERTLDELGYAYNGKFTIPVPINNNADDVLNALNKVISVFETHAAIAGKP